MLGAELRMVVRELIRRPIFDIMVAYNRALTVIVILTLSGM